MPTAKGYQQTALHQERVKASWTAERRSAFAAFRTGRKHSESTIKKISKKAAGNQRFLGKKHTQDTKNKMAAAAVKRLQRRTRTALEAEVASWLTGATFVEQTPVKGDPYHAWDFVLPNERVLIEADGCYWHGCERCGHKPFGNTARSDAAKNRMSLRLGWLLIRVKECELEEARKLVLCVI